MPSISAGANVVTNAYSSAKAARSSSATSQAQAPKLSSVIADDAAMVSIRTNVTEYSDKMERGYIQTESTNPRSTIDRISSVSEFKGVSLDGGGDGGGGGESSPVKKRP